MFSFNTKLKKIFPKTLFSRLILILIVPTVLIQILTIYTFYQKHWDVISKKITETLAIQISEFNKYFNSELERGLSPDKILENMHKTSDFKVNFSKDSKIYRKKLITYKKYSPSFTFDPESQFRNDLASLINEDMRLFIRDKTYYLHIQKKDGLLQFAIPKKRIISSTTKSFVVWNVMTALFMSLVAILFLKNQIKSIKKLTIAAKKFSMDQDSGYFRPTGAKEIREAGFAFIDMRDKIKKFIEQRTRILAGISHDLRTPLTRIKLQLEMMDKNEDVELIRRDIDDMEKMINEYLTFAKGEKGEQIKKVNIVDFFNGIISNYKRFGNDNIVLENNIKKAEYFYIKEILFKRAIENIINNALKYGTNVLVSLKDGKKRLRIEIEDNGVGVSEEELKKISEPFYKIDNSRNLKDTSVGLGLAITKDIVQGHGGIIEFKISKRLGGLSVVIKVLL